MKLPFRIAVRFLKSSIGQTILIAFGIAIGVSVQIFIGSLIQGLQISLVDNTIGNQPQISITSLTDDKLISNYDKVMGNITKEQSDIKNISASANGPALVNVNEDTYSILVRGFNIDEADKMYNIKENIIEGAVPTKDYEVLIGKDLQLETGMKVGDEIEVLTNFGAAKKFVVSGFFDLGVSSLNKSWVIATIQTAQDMFQLGDKATGIDMQVKDVFAADTLAASIASTVGKDLQVDNWKVQNEQLLSGLSGQSISSIMIQVFVMISVLLGIASVLAITVVQKSKQIGILKAMGIKDRTASLIFLFQGLLLGIAGGILGVALGLGLAFTFTKFAVNSDGTPVVPLYIDYKFILLSALIAVGASTLAALIPARKSLKLNPIEVIRNA